MIVMTLACIIKLEMNVIDDPSLGLASSITTVSDAQNCIVTYDRHYDDRNCFIIQATGHRSTSFKFMIDATKNIVGEFDNRH
jgi:hypothetical protein